MTPEEENIIKEKMDEVYAVGFKNGQIEMKNKVMMKINRDWSIVGIGNPVDVAMHFLKRINKIPLSKKFTKIK